MRKKQNGGQNSEAVTPHRSALISRNFLTSLFKLPKKLIFAVAETADDEGGVKTSPVVAILGMQEYISLASGEMMTCTRALGIKQDLYPAIVIYNAATETFTFKSSVGSVVRISVETLIRNFGTGIITRLG